MVVVVRGSRGLWFVCRWVDSVCFVRIFVPNMLFQFPSAWGGATSASCARNWCTVVTPRADFSDLPTMQKQFPLPIYGSPKCEHFLFIPSSNIHTSALAAGGVLLCGPSHPPPTPIFPLASVLAQCVHVPIVVFEIQCPPSKFQFYRRHGFELKLNHNHCFFPDNEVLHFSIRVI